MPSLAIIGAGLAGISLARLLSDRYTIKLFDKSRGVSGRLATRRFEIGEFDHGAQYFTARNPHFLEFLQPALSQGQLAVWKPRLRTIEVGKPLSKRSWFEPHYVGTPSMTSWLKSLAEGLDIQRECTIQKLERQAQGWYLNEQWGPFDWVVSTLPAPQTDQILPGQFDLQQVQMQPCYALLLRFSEMPKCRWEAAVVKNSKLAWLAWNQTKPRRSPQPCLVAHSSNAWAQQHWDQDPEISKNQMLEELWKVTGFQPELCDEMAFHRWRYAHTSQPLCRPYLLEHHLQVAVCADWCLESRAEAAYLSARALAEAL
jgi:renalase